MIQDNWPATINSAVIRVEPRELGFLLFIHNVPCLLEHLIVNFNTMLLSNTHLFEPHALSFWLTMGQNLLEKLYGRPRPLLIWFN